MLGNFIKYLSIIAACIGGVAIYRSSRPTYWGLGWAAVIGGPLTILSMINGSGGAAALFTKPGHEDIFIFIWIFIGLLELFVLWIPIVGKALGTPEKAGDGDGKTAP